MVLSLQRMADNIGSQPNGSRHGQLRTAPYRRRSPRAPDDEDVPIDAMAHLHLGGHCRRRQLTAVPLPTWGQVKKLTGEGQKMLQRTAKPLTAENLFLAMCALLTVTSAAANVSYWAFVPNPPLLEPVTWGDMDVSVYTTPNILSPPRNNLTHLNINDGSLFNFKYSSSAQPLCLGPFPCLAMGWQRWMLPGATPQKTRVRLQRLTAWSINSTLFEGELSLPSCPDFTYIGGLKYRPFLWQECQGTFGKMVKDYVAWGPFGQFINICSEWNITTCDLSNVTRMPDQLNDSVQGPRLMTWGDGGIADPRWAHQQAPTAIQTHLWKIAAALKSVVLSNGSFTGTAASTSTYNFTVYKEYNITACVPLPCVLLVGNISIGSTITCIN
ncbi:hypothetical protein STEG23_024760, partial [Scotinomys teguina]